jgi:hypothetical protein
MLDDTTLQPDGRLNRPATSVLCLNSSPFRPLDFVSILKTYVKKNQPTPSKATCTAARVRSLLPTRSDHMAAWQKVLWVQQPYPDNHTGESFLLALVVNEGRRRTYWRVVAAALAVDQQICAAAIVSSVAHGLQQVHPGDLFTSEDADCDFAPTLSTCGVRCRALWTPAVRCPSSWRCCWLVGCCTAARPLARSLWELRPPLSLRVGRHRRGQQEACRRWATPCCCWELPARCRRFMPR